MPVDAVHPTTEPCMGHYCQKGMMIAMNDKRDVKDFLSDGGSVLFAVIAVLFIAGMIYGVFAS